MYSSQEEENLLRGDPDFVIDAIDDIDTKVNCFQQFPAISILFIVLWESCILGN